MVSLEALVLVVALSATSQPQLLDFTADWCAPCQSMQPTIQRLEAQGYPIRRINVDQHPELVRQYSVTGIPCFVMIADGRVVDRIEGPASYARLIQMLQAGGARSAAATVEVRGQSPDSGGPLERTASLAPGYSAVSEVGSMANQAAPLAAPYETSGFAQQPPAPPSNAGDPVQQRALQASVRLRVEDASGQSVGTGTIIDVHGDEALVVTCGHIFRESQGSGKINVECFLPGMTGPVAGTLIAYDAEDRDIGLVSIRPGVPVQPAPVAPPGYKIAAGQPVFSVGCDGGADPSVRPSQITAVDKYMGAPNIEVAGQPVDGRSGGGLFSQDGMLIGICNAADPADNEGIYAALATIHWQLDEIGQSRIYQQAASLAEAAPPQNTAASVVPVAAIPQNKVPTSNQLQQLSQPPAQLDAVPVAAAAPGAEAMPGSAELICILRNKDNPHGQSEVIVLQQPSPELLSRLSHEMQTQRASGPQLSNQLQSVPVVRGQSR